MEKEIPSGDQLKILFHAAPALIPLLRLRREQSVQKLIGELRNGTADLRATATEIATYDDLLREIERTLAQGA